MSKAIRGSFWKKRKLLFFQRGVCPICLNGISIENDQTDLDHIVPRLSIHEILGSKINKNGLFNLQVVHLECNRLKREVLPSESDFKKFLSFKHNAVFKRKLKRLYSAIRIVLNERETRKKEKEEEKEERNDK